MKSSWESHNGKAFFYGRYSGLKIEELRTECAEIVGEIKEQPPKSVLLLVDPR